jgi:phenylpropionate dioxygenase-like ring-hydroxylating dioxygenase large terminal subunit
MAALQERTTEPPAVYDTVVGSEAGPLPEVLLRSSPGDLGVGDIDAGRYTAQAIHDLEVEHLWKHTWQWACREADLGEVGDYVIYTIAEIEIVIVRTAPGRLGAFHNTCLHRGTALCTDPSGHVGGFTCPFHGWAYGLDGTLQHVPAGWDFPQADCGGDRLAPVQVESWDGWVFVNLDPQARPLIEHLGVLPEHFARWPMADRLKVTHVRKVVRANWKVVREQFMESYHGPLVHPQLQRSHTSYEAQYDYFPPNVARMMSLAAVPNSFTGEAVSEQELADAFTTAFCLPAVQVPPAASARGVLAEAMRTQMATLTGLDYGGVTDAEMIDGVEYLLFPNFAIWAGYSMGLAYRWTPHGNDPHQSVMDIMILTPPGGSSFAGVPHDQWEAPMRHLGPDDTIGDSAPELGLYGPVFDQDLSLSSQIQRGLRSAARGLKMGRYQEANIRAFHRRLDGILTGRDDR